jgi:F-type H+-transporting ATPase subunit a
MEHVSWITHFVNQHLGSVAVALFSALHIQPNHPELPIPEHVVMALVVLVVGTLLAFWVRFRLSIERPGASQQIAEILLTNPLGFGIRDLLDENVPHDGRRYIHMVGTIGLFVLLANLLSVFPAFTSPTVNASVPLACASLVFIYFVSQGIRVQGAGGYLMHFAGSPKTPVDWGLAVLLFPVEIISTLARILSLTVRLWANIVASDLIYGIFVGLLAAISAWGWEKSHVLGAVLAIFPALIPIAFVGLHIFVSIVQAYIFTILPSVYLGLATEHEL